MTDILSRHNANARTWAVLIAYANGELSEGVACRLLPIDRVGLRGCIQDACEVARLLDKRYREDGTTVSMDAVKEAAERHFQGRAFGD